MKTLHGNYVQIDGEWYLLCWTSSRVKAQAGQLKSRIDLLRRAAGCLIEVTSTNFVKIDEQSPLFQRILFLIYFDIAGTLSNMVSLAQTGSLADSLTLSRPVLEYLLDIDHLVFYPEAISQYEAKVEQHNALVALEGVVVRDPRYNMRFMNSGRMIKKLQKRGDLTDVQQLRINRYHLVSAIAEHTSPERKTLSSNRDLDWNNVVGVLEEICFFAYHTLSDVDPELAVLALQNQEFDEIRSQLYTVMGYK